MEQLLKLFVCCAGVFVCYLFYGVFQERVTRGKYVDGEKFQFATSLVFVQCVTNALFAQGALLFQSKSGRKVPWYLFVMAAGSYVAAMLCSNMALQFVSYPTQVLVKSCKPVSVLILGVIVAGKRYPLLRYLCVLLIVSGAAIFLYPKDKPSVAKMEGNEVVGNLFLAGSLFCDGLTGALQEKTNAYSVSSHQLMFKLNFFSLFYLGAGLIYLGEVPAFLAFVGRNPMVVKDILAFCLLSCLGQNFIFMTVTSFGSLVCSLVTTTRKFFTIVFSVLLFGNSLASQQWLGIVLVFTGLFIEGLSKRKSSPKPVADVKKES